MEKFELDILGCGSATPTTIHNPSSQVLNVRDKLFMIDCGEGTQLQLRRSKLRFGRLNRIFISHLHGDHCFGLIGLISTLALLGRMGDLYIHTVAGLEETLAPELAFFCKDNPFQVKIETFDPKKSEVIYEDRSVTVKTIPLLHRVPCAGFLFEEKQKEAHLLPDMIKFYNIPVKSLAKIKQGADYVTEEGRVIPHTHLTTPADLARSYAYCSDTAYSEKIIPIIEGIDLLYHEATFAEADALRAKETGHSTAKQAATIAKMANVKKLMLGHFSARYNNNKILLDEAKGIFPNTILANEGLREKL
ncbi:ribonuclease Z [Dysgonomonas sp. PFB1-18]|uniref:ribonuclease Z n=1 Tax=unclassified Dysgonomonas TaxID=2630389 RepID=UPI002474D71E|nr:MULTISPECIES: ribonuclease Z [unclassified Dysgonomonas]MDH6307198.1 ribonuclease Z [Dysgonomonas sp. PF1-14]MDH6337117.1 ribonuclease Z [Dysgonomonas sp. PF1-16]MDH6381103.1 ribonuclease Z [Dysgonomonas sp. PFB1-18]MDH6396318.1 ribonuclease Z [Dysgonomonas sp. PF1-23]